MAIPNHLRKSPRIPLHTEDSVKTLTPAHEELNSVVDPVGKMIKETVNGDEPLNLEPLRKGFGRDGVKDKTDTLAKRVEALGIGEITSSAIKVDPQMHIGEFAATGHDLRDKLRNRIQSSVRLAASRNGTSYNIEVGNMITPQGHLFIVAVITRYK